MVNINIYNLHKQKLLDAQIFLFYFIYLSEGERERHKQGGAAGRGRSTLPTELGS